MEVCLVRHAIAVERGAAGYSDDRVRPLTADGRKRMAEAAAGLTGLFVAEKILSSPLLRARQTAEILGKAWKLPVVEVDGLGNGDHAGLLETLGGVDAERVALVGHEPWMSEFLSVLLTGDPSLVASEFRKGAAALAWCDGPARAGNFHLRWLIQPGGLRAMGRGRSG